MAKKELMKKVVKGTAKTVVVKNPTVEKTEKPKAEKTEKIAKISLGSEQVYAAMEKGVEYTSTVLRDKLKLDKESGRGQIRKVMKQLEKEGKVTISEKSLGKRKQYVYSLA
jgi:hypothetical protein